MTIQEDQQEAMQKTWIDFCREGDLDQDSDLGNHAIAEKWGWWVRKNYHEPLPNPEAVKHWEN